jgi:uncharacterized protein
VDSPRCRRPTRAQRPTTANAWFVIHGFAGAEINRHSRGRRFDDEFLWPILERAEALGVPIYLHPPRPPQRAMDLLTAGNVP